ncbi:MAG TPA: nicotinate-nucleotide adenylyltransferase [Longimicrobium sp.]|jgi:nicotinate-nucleotide adenylyltransferase
MRIGVFGGTFDPPHLGHLVVASDACEALGLGRVLWIPSAVPPHKLATVQASATARLEMVRAAVEGDPRFEADDVELRREGPSYTVDTLRELATRHPGDELVLLIGADNLREIPGWREPGEILRLARVAVLSRDGAGVPPDAPIPATSVAVTRVDVSATEVRRRAAAGETIRYLVPDAVRALVERRGLYRELPRL